MISCKETENDFENIPSKLETITYLENHLSNGNTIANMTWFETNEKFEIKDDEVTYISRFTEPENDVDWLITNKFSINDIEYINETTTGSKKQIILNLRNKSNRRLYVSLNNEPIPFPDDENIDRVYIEPESKDFNALIKAFKNLLKLKNDKMKSNYFEN